MLHDPPKGGEGSPAKVDYSKKGALILTSLLEDLEKQTSRKTQREVQAFEPKPGDVKKEVPAGVPCWGWPLFGSKGKATWNNVAPNLGGICWGHCHSARLMHVARGACKICFIPVAFILFLNSVKGVFANHRCGKTLGQILEGFGQVAGGLRCRFVSAVIFCLLPFWLKRNLLQVCSWHLSPVCTFFAAWAS